MNKRENSIFCNFISIKRADYRYLIKDKQDDITNKNGPFIYLVLNFTKYQSLSENTVKRDVLNLCYVHLMLGT